MRRESGLAGVLRDGAGVDGSNPTLLLCEGMGHPTLWLVMLVTLVGMGGMARAQGNYEIQVYGADTVPAKNTMVELHSNYTVSGQRYVIDGVYPTYHQEHETVEITNGINDWSEVGFYIFTSEQNGHGVQWVGDHIRPRVRVPDSWHWPVGVSLSTEIGYQAGGVLAGYVDVGDPAHCRQDDWTVVLRVQSGAGADVAWAGCESGAGVFTGFQGGV